MKNKIYPIAEELMLGKGTQVIHSLMHPAGTGWGQYQQIIIDLKKVCEMHERRFEELFEYKLLSLQLRGKTNGWSLNKIIKCSFFGVVYLVFKMIQFQMDGFQIFFMVYHEFILFLIDIIFVPVTREFKMK